MNRTCLITGASAGIGRATAQKMSAAGWTLGLLARNESALAELAKDLPGPSVILKADVTSEPQIKAAFARFVEQTGRLDCLFNNAGLFTPAKPFDETPTEDWLTSLNVNLTGMFLCAREAFSIMRRQSPQGGRIINNGSISAHVPREGAAPYTVTKHGVTGLTRQIALDGRPHQIACGQIDIGNAETDLLRDIAKTAVAAGNPAPPMIDTDLVADAVLAMANLPLEANTLFQTLMATQMPYVGRG